MARQLTPTLAALVLLGCIACGQPTLREKPAFLSTSTNDIDFGDIELGKKGEQTLFLINQGDLPIFLQPVEGDSKGGVFAAVPSATDIPAGNDVIVKVIFSPAAEMEYASVFTFENDSQNEPNFRLAVSGTGIAPDLCAGVQCKTPPVPACLGSSTSRIYDPAGSCVEGECEYAPFTESCSFGCDQAAGLCLGDPCIGIVCNTPPNECFGATGTCNGGVCSYPTANETLCNDGNACTVSDSCLEGVCRGQSKQCNDPPPSTCEDDSNRTVWLAQGTCSSDGSCVYEDHNQSCSFGCVDGNCSGNPCADVVCDSPPSTCYSSQGTCEDGLCTYDVVNGGSCSDLDLCTTNDKCMGGSCYGSASTCTSPPANICMDENTLRKYDPVGSCNGTTGECGYTQSPISCQFGCESDACRNEPVWGNDVLTAAVVFSRGDGNIVAYDGRDVDLELINPRDALDEPCAWKAPGAEHTIDWGDYGSCQWSPLPISYNNETVQHFADTEDRADGVYLIRTVLRSTCARLYCVGDFCYCEEERDVNVTVEIRVNGNPLMTCTHSHDRDDDDGTLIEHATITRADGYYGAPTGLGTCEVVVDE